MKVCCLSCKYCTTLLDYENYPKGKYKRICCTALMDNGKQNIVMVIYKPGGRCENYVKHDKPRMHKYDKIGENDV